MSVPEVDRYRANWQDEIDSAVIYRAMAAREADPSLAALYVRLAEVEERHLDFWESQLRAAGAEPGPRRPTWRGRVLRFFASRFGPSLVLPTVASLEEMDQHVYDDQPETAGTAMRGQERSHARLLRFLASGSPAGIAGETLARIEGRHRMVGGNTLRAAVLGANDGLTSNLSLVMGVVGADLDSTAIVLAGIAGLLAGSFSMAMGEWISVQSSREMYERLVRTEREEIELVPDEEREELQLIYQAKGLPADEAQELAARMMQDQSAALDALSREELGLDPSELGGSPWIAAISSFVLFSLGAVVPLLPFFFAEGVVAVVASLLAASAGLFVIGAAITLLTGRSAAFSGTRQLVFGLAAALATYSVGRLVGVAVG